MRQQFKIYQIKDAFFNKDIHPEDMDFEIRFVGDRFQNGVPQQYYLKY